MDRAVVGSQRSVGAVPIAASVFRVNDFLCLKAAPQERPADSVNMSREKFDFYSRVGVSSLMSIMLCIYHDPYSAAKNANTSC